jgi:hypothetical protein
MNTLINTNLDVNWCDDNDVFLDLHLWKKHKGITFTPEKPISLGIKHGIGLCGGSGHNRMVLTEHDNRMEFLELLVDSESFKFYKKL